LQDYGKNQSVTFFQNFKDNQNFQARYDMRSEISPQVKSPLRYPGGKSKALAQIMARLPPDFAEYREPFVGGGAVFIHLRRWRPALKMWINDLNFDLFCFWKEAQKDAARLAARIAAVKSEKSDGRALFESLRAGDATALSDFERAVRFFILNRITFSGTIEAGGYSQQAFERRFTDSSIARVAALHEALQDVRVTNLDYRDVVREDGERTFIFLDPPYFSATKSRLYGKSGVLHTTFAHDEFAQAMAACRHSWLITYDDSPKIRENFAFANCHEWELQYGMNNYKQERAAKGKELFIANYRVTLQKTEPAWLPFANACVG
jgi:DNA adenine methylase